MTSLPPTATRERESVILQMVKEGSCDYTWSTITSEHNDHRADFSVFTDALKIEGIRVNVTAETQQLIADHLDAMLLTPKLADLLWMQRDTTLPPFPRGNTNGMSTTQAMIEHSEKIDKALGAMSNPYGILGTVGKHWVIDNALATKVVGTAMNYGWHFVKDAWAGYSEACASGAKDPNTGQIIRLIQGRGTRHDMQHVDYSQVCVLVHKVCTVDGTEMNLTDVLQKPELAPLASHQGVLRVLRQPGV
jgi:hypothetical protein